MAELYYEDFSPGRVFQSRVYALTAEEIKAYAREFDWLPFHVDEAAADASILGGLCASGWHASSIMMRLIADTYIDRAAGMGSFGVEECRWIKPVRPGDYHLRAEVLDARVSAKRPEMGIVTVLWQLFNSEGVLVVEMRGVNLFKTRASEVAHAG
ncbi:MaoC family dehydratase [Rhodoligotrophos defluvii]|uniref:MaoC family dehydratase n=1 Tax=Rhodoligotrophos defluvii TaxID=2561934 RepID=UPI0010C9C42D|nr:MaoC family dehydratase [Rhodoligotrophos defluvii]